MMSRFIIALLLMLAVPSFANNVAQEGDRDGDGIADAQDNCADVANPDQADADGDLIGDACEEVDGGNGNDTGDGDGDGEGDGEGDGDGDTGNGDPSDLPFNPNLFDKDGDGVLDADDNCPDVANSDQADADADGIGDLCEEGVGDEPPADPGLPSEPATPVPPARR